MRMTMVIVAALGIFGVVVSTPASAGLGVDGGLPGAASAADTDVQAQFRLAQYQETVGAASSSAKKKKKPKKKQRYERSN
jgi:hypothetical protein